MILAMVLEGIARLALVLDIFDIGLPCSGLGELVSRVVGGEKISAEVIVGGIRHRARLQGGHLVKEEGQRRRMW